jgi:hypothetical protein
VKLRETRGVTCRALAIGGFGESRWRLRPKADLSYCAANFPFLERGASGLALQSRFIEAHFNDEEPDPAKRAKLHSQTLQTLCLCGKAIGDHTADEIIACFERAKKNARRKFKAIYGRESNYDQGPGSIDVTSPLLKIPRGRDFDDIARKRQLAGRIKPTLLARSLPAHR